MIRALLRKGDGSPGGRGWLDSVVMHLQRGLIQAGHPMDADGWFGAGTERGLKAFQQGHALPASGAADRPLWGALAPHLEAALGAAQRETAQLLPGYAGDLEWVHAREGHRGRPYWPGGDSGVTLDPGFDLGHADPALFRRLYQPVLGADGMRAAERTLGKKGAEANAALRADPALQAIRIGAAQAYVLMPHAARTYWRYIAERFSALSRPEAPPSVQTALLSLAYNRGAGNEALDVLAGPLREGDWAGAADLIGRMQQDHDLPGIRERRRWEADLIRAELEFLEQA